MVGPKNDLEKFHMVACVLLGVVAELPPSSSVGRRVGAVSTTSVVAAEPWGEAGDGT